MGLFIGLLIIVLISTIVTMYMCLKYSEDSFLNALLINLILIFLMLIITPKELFALALTGCIIILFVLTIPIKLLFNEFKI